MSKYYSLYNNIKLRKGGRKIAKLSETLFVEKAKAFILNVCKDDEYTVEKINNTNATNKIIAEVLWEITFNGYSPDDIDSFCSKLTNSFESCK